MSGGLPPQPHIPSWHTKGQLHNRYSYFPVKCHAITKKYKLYELKVSEEGTSCFGLYRVEMGRVADVSEERATSI
jgi:hypothetical protein